MVAKGWCLGVFPRERQEQAAARLRAVAREQRRELQLLRHARSHADAGERVQHLRAKRGWSEPPVDELSPRAVLRNI